MNSTRKIHYNVHPTTLKIFLEQDFPDMGSVDVSRSTNAACNCFGAFTWQITFVELQGSIPEMSVNTSGFEVLGANATVLASTKRESNSVSGTFRLSMPEFTHPGYTTRWPARTTPPLSYSASAADIKAAIQNYLWDHGNVSVSRSSADLQGGFTWRVEFTPKCMLLLNI